MQLHTAHADLFGVVKPVAERVAIMKWNAVSKHQSVPVFFSRNMEWLGLLMTTADMKAISTAGEAWLTECGPAVMRLQAASSLGDAMLSAKLVDLVSHRLKTVFSVEVLNAGERVVREGEGRRPSSGGPDAR